MTAKPSLPPFKALVALECVVRHRSVSRAAEELCVTHGAVSKQLALLTDWLGRPLFTDNRRGMVPTSIALRLSQGVDTGLRAIEEALDTVREATPEEPDLRILAPGSFAIYWLIPRLPELRVSGLRMKAHVHYTHTNENWQHLPHDLAIRTDGDFPEARARAPLFNDVLGLVAAPALAALIDEPKALARLTFLESETRPGELDRWLGTVEMSRDRLRHISIFEHNYVAIEAAIAGQGAIVAPLTVVGNHLARGMLVQVLTDFTVPGPRYVAIYNPHATNARHACAFAHWMNGLGRVNAPVSDAALRVMTKKTAPAPKRNEAAARQYGIQGP